MNNKKAIAVAIAMLTAATAVPTNVMAVNASYVKANREPRAIRTTVSVQAANQAAAAITSVGNIDKPTEETKKNTKEESNTEDNKVEKPKEEDKKEDNKKDKEDLESQKSGKKLKVNDLEVSKNKKEVSGRVKNHQDAKISIYFEGEKVGSGKTDKKGKFSVSVDKKVEDNSDLEVFAGTGKGYSNKTKDSSKKEIEPKNVDLKNSDKTIVAEFKNLKNEDIEIYYEGKKIGSAKTDSDSTLEFRHNKKIKDKDDLEFYIEKESKKEAQHKDIFITKAIPRTNVVEGTATADSKVEIKTAIIDVKIGEAKANSDGKFIVTLNRELIPGERIVALSFVDDKETSKAEYNVPESFEDKKDIVSEKGNGYIKGYEDGSFKPENKVTRSEASVMFARLINGSDTFTTNDFTKFVDANNQWYSKAVNFVIHEELINGYEDGTFRPDENITRAEFATIVSKYIKSNDSKLADLKDIKNHWAEEAINKVYAAGYIKGYEDNTFRPDNEITRAEAVTILNAVFNVKANENAKVSFTDVAEDAWYFNDIIKASK